MRYALVGIGLGVAKGLAELKIRARAVFAISWPLLMVTLGILLMSYQE